MNINHNLGSGVVYAISCSSNGKSYIGSTKRKPNQRRLEHLHHLRKGTHHSRYLQNAYSKHGESSLVFAVIEEVQDLNMLLAREQFHIWRNAGLSMNSAEVSESHLAAAIVNTGRVQSAEERSRRSVSQIESYASGDRCKRVWTEEQRLAHSVRLTGRKMPKVKDSTRENISKALKGRDASWAGIKKSVETRTNFINIERPHWLELRSSGMSYREMERKTGRCRKILQRECSRVLDETRAH